MENRILALENYKENSRDRFHSVGNSLDIHEKQIAIHGQRLDKLDDHRENVNIALTVMKGTQENHGETINKLVEYTTKIDKGLQNLEKFNTKAIAIGVTGVTFVGGILGILIKVYQVFSSHIDVTIK